MDKIFVKNNKRRRQRFFCQKTGPQAKLIKENAPQARFFSTES